MKPDPDVIKRLLDAFERCPKPFPSLRDVRKQDDSLCDDDCIAFHLLLMEECGLVADANGDPGVGVSVGADGGITLTTKSLRLTANGHDFAQQLRDPVVYEKVKSVMGTSGLAVAVSVAGDLMTQFATQLFGLGASP